MQEEIWKDLPNYEGLYQVSSLGRVKSLSKENYSGEGLKKSNEKILKHGLDNQGYYHVCLYKNGIQKTFNIHQLVAIVFLNHNPCGHKLVVDHINDIKTDNSVENLQIISHRENVYKTQGKHTSNYKGVYWYKQRNKWRSMIYINGKRKHLGYFKNELEAKIAYQNELNSINK